jgi:translation initiation factor IF-3
VPPADRSSPNVTQSHRVNEQIRISPLRVVDSDGTMLGIISRDEALAIAREKDLDLVEVAPTERPPVCKVMDYGKFKFEQTKKTRKSKAQHTHQKEIRLRPQCGENDLEVKLRRAREFLEHKDKVQFTVQFRGREMAHIEVGLELVQRVVDALSDVAKVERKPSRDGRRITAVLAPK